MGWVGENTGKDKESKLFFCLSLPNPSTVVCLWVIEANIFWFHVWSKHTKFPDCSVDPEYRATGNQGLAHACVTKECREPEGTSPKTWRRLSISPSFLPHHVHLALHFFPCFSRVLAMNARSGQSLFGALDVKMASQSWWKRYPFCKWYGKRKMPPLDELLVMDFFS